MTIVTTYAEYNIMVTLHAIVVCTRGKRLCNLFEGNANRHVFVNENMISAPRSLDDYRTHNSTLQNKSVLAGLRHRANVQWRISEEVITIIVMLVLLQTVPNPMNMQ